MTDVHAERLPRAASAVVFTQFCASGLWPGVGASLAAAMSAAGIDGPHKVTAAALEGLPKVTPKRADRLFTAWIGALHTYALVELLVPQELPPRWAGRLVDSLGEDAAARLVADPWSLLLIGEATVAQADRLALAVEPGARRDDPRRGRALVDWTLARFARAGHTVTPVGQLADALRPFGVDAAAAIRAAVDAELVQELPRPDSDVLVARTVLAKAEAEIATHIKRLLRTGVSLAGERAARTASEGLDAVQTAAVLQTAASGVSILTGGPGTGKSRTVAAVVNLCRKVGVDIVLAAPTGRAAKRLEELSGEPATTVHRLLGARPLGRRGEDGFAGLFEHDAGNPIDADVVVVDETSMLDVELCAALLAALPDTTHLLIVGDPAQLPSIGPGRVLGDMLASGAVPVTELRTLYRQSEGGSIARLATAVRGGVLPAVHDETREVVIVPCGGSAEAARRVVQLVTDSIPRVFGTSGDGLQVVTPVHRGPAGTQELNKLLKERLNPGRGTVRGFDVGDRVVATANHLDAEPTGFANGEVGTVVSVGNNSVRIAFTGGESDVSGKALGDLLHGWAITVHRAQGSEWDAVVAVMPPEAGQMLSRPLVYTALTRARRHLSVVHAAGPALARAVRQVGAEPRRTRLEQLLSS